MGDFKRPTSAQAGNRTPGSCVGGDYVTTTPLARMVKLPFYILSTANMRQNRPANLHLFTIITSTFTRLIWTETIVAAWTLDR